MDKSEIVWILFAISLLQTARSLIVCPADICTCQTFEIASRLETTVACNIKRDYLGYVPVFKPYQRIISSLDLSKTELTILGNWTFNDLAAVRELYLNDNYLSKIEANAFAGIDYTVELLDLQHNRIRDLTFLTTHDFSSLRELQLRDNRLSEIRPDSFMLLRSLETLILDENSIGQTGHLEFLQQPSLKGLTTLNLDANHLTEVHPDDFVYLTNLRSLLVNRNKLSNINFLSHSIFKQLQGIGAANNQLGNVDPSLFSDKHLMKWIDLSANQLTNASFLSSCSLHKLEEIYLTSNGLTEIPTDSFRATKDLTVFVVNNNQLESLPRCALLPFYKRMRTFDISNNPMECDCEMKWLLDSHRITTEHPSECANMESLFTNNFETDHCAELPLCVALDKCSADFGWDTQYQSVTDWLIQQSTVKTTSSSDRHCISMYVLVIFTVSCFWPWS